MKKGFTLAEILIVLTVIAILTAILLPAARNAMPNQDVMKFKKAHNALHTAIQELVNSDEYYLDGDLGIRADGTLIDGTHDGDWKYFCETLSDVLNAKSKNCTDGDDAWALAVWGEDTPETTVANSCDSHCGGSWNISEEIVTQDGVFWYQENPKEPYGILTSIGTRSFHRKNSSGMLQNYKCVCADIDERNGGLKPFSWGVRVDGKIINGNRAQEWLLKSIQEKE